MDSFRIQYVEIFCRNLNECGTGVGYCGYPSTTVKGRLSVFVALE